MGVMRRNNDRMGARARQRAAGKTDRWDVESARRVQPENRRIVPFQTTVFILRNHEKCVMGEKSGALACSVPIGQLLIVYQTVNQIKVDRPVNSRIVNRSVN